MIKEFALEPDALSTWESFRYFIEKFGVPQGRLIAEFPGRWRRMVIDAAQRVAKPVEFARIVERLRQVGDEVLWARGRPGGDGTRPWLERAIVEHARDPFAAIIACSNPQALPHVMIQSEVDASDARFDVQRQVQVERTAEKLIACAEVLLRDTTTVKWVDYIIDLSKARWRRPLEAALEILKHEGRPVLFEIHRQCGNDIEKANLCRQFRDALDRHAKDGIKFALHLHPEKLLHDRFVLTDRGGLQIGHGLDDNEDGGNAATANVTLLDDGMYKAQWAMFSGGNSVALRIGT